MNAQPLSIWRGAVLSSLLGIACTAAQAANKAVVVGPTYPGGPAFDDTIAQERADQMAASLEKWGNWKNNVNKLTGNVTCANIATAIANAGAGMQAGDIFLFIYHGHGSYVLDNETVPPAADTCDETIWPNQDCLDDDLQAALAGLPNGVRKLVILASCYGGGFWNGQDEGDLEKLTQICLLTGADECSCLPEPSTFVDNLLARLDPTGWPGQDSVTFQEFLDAVTAGAAGSAVNQNRWVDLPKCPCEEPDPIHELCDFDYYAYFERTLDFDTLETALVKDTQPAACCIDGGYFCQVMPVNFCYDIGGSPLEAGAFCQGDLNGNGLDDACEQARACPGDCNCDGLVNFADINPFVAGLSSPSQQCNPTNFDINGNGGVGFDDINPFVALLSSSSLPIVCP